MKTSIERNKISGANIRRLRLEKLLTRQQLADKLGASYQCIKLWEDGLNFPSRSKIEALAKILECPPGELLFEFENKSLSTEEQALINAFKKSTRKKRQVVKMILEIDNEIEFSADYVINGAGQPRQIVTERKNGELYGGASKACW